MHYIKDDTSKQIKHLVFVNKIALTRFTRFHDSLFIKSKSIWCEISVSFNKQTTLIWNTSKNLLVYEPDVNLFTMKYFNIVSLFHLHINIVAHINNY